MYAVPKFKPIAAGMQKTAMDMLKYATKYKAAEAINNPKTIGCLGVFLHFLRAWLAKYTEIPQIIKMAASTPYQNVITLSNGHPVNFQSE